MIRTTKPKIIENLSWQAIMDSFPNCWTALRVDEASDDGIKSGRLIASGKSEMAVRGKLREFRAANPGVQFALFSTLPMKSNLDLLLTWPS